MVKASLLRISAQKYATGLIKFGDYLAYRRELLDAIDNDDPLPELPEEWVHLQGNQTSPELQSLMIQMHERDESGPTILPRSERKTVLAGLLILLLISLAVFFFDRNTNVSQTKPTAQSYQSDNLFIQQVSQLNQQDHWDRHQLQSIINYWKTLSSMEKVALKREIPFTQFKQKVATKLAEIRQQQGDNDETALLSEVTSALN